MPHIVLVALELRPELVPGRRPQPDAAVVAAGRQPLCGGTGQVTAVSSGALVAGAGSEGQAPEAGAGRAEGRRGGKGRGEGKEEACACVCVCVGRWGCLTWPSGAQAMQETRSRWPVQAFSVVSVSVDLPTTRASAPETPRQWAAGKAARAGRRGGAGGGHQRRTVLSPEPEASLRLSGENCRAMTGWA